MRCPKCGYISFDHLKECRKCNKNIETISAGLFGSTYNIEAPTFLNLNREQREASSSQMGLSENQSFMADDDYVDEELAILVEEEDADKEGEINFAEDTPISMASSDDDKQDDGEIEIDFNQFEETGTHIELSSEAETPQQAKRNSLKIDMPAALSDISDLAPPPKSIEKDAQSFRHPAAEPNFADLDLDDLNFDLGLDGLDEDAKKSPTPPEKDALSLGELDFSDTLAESISDTARKTEDMDLDLDLDFDLDLGGLSIHKEA